MDCVCPHVRIHLFVNDFFVHVFYPIHKCGYPSTGGSIHVAIQCVCVRWGGGFLWVSTYLSISLFPCQLVFVLGHLGSLFVSQYIHVPIILHGAARHGRGRPWSRTIPPSSVVVPKVCSDRGMGDEWEACLGPTHHPGAAPGAVRCQVHLLHDPQQLTDVSNGIKAG